MADLGRLPRQHQEVGELRSERPLQRSTRDEHHVDVRIGLHQLALLVIVGLGFSVLLSIFAVPWLWSRFDRTPEPDRDPAPLHNETPDAKLTLWNTSILLKHVGDAFDPAVGFVDRRGVRTRGVSRLAHGDPRAGNQCRRVAGGGAGGGVLR
mgnify:CR=1 FL=1